MFLNLMSLALVLLFCILSPSKNLALSKEFRFRRELISKLFLNGSKKLDNLLAMTVE